MHFHGDCCIIPNSQDMNTTQVPINEWINRKDVEYIHNGILFSHNKEEYPSICGNTDVH